MPEEGKVYCRDCGEPIDGKAEICPECGVRQKTQASTLLKQFEEFEVDGVDLSRYPIKEGAIYGFGAYVVGVILNIILVIVANVGEANMTNQSWRAGVWTYHLEHNVNIYVNALGQTGALTPQSLGLGLIVLGFIPILLLIGAGYKLANETTPEGINDSIIDGATVTVGYLLAVIVIGLIISPTGNIAGNASPSILGSLTLAGLVYPIVFGGFGGILTMGDVGDVDEYSDAVGMYLLALGLILVISLMMFNTFVPMME